jgi:hypothetical protein
MLPIAVIPGLTRNPVDKEFLLTGFPLSRE